MNPSKPGSPNHSPINHPYRHRVTHLHDRPGEYGALPEFQARIRSTFEDAILKERRALDRVQPINAAYPDAQAIKARLIHLNKRRGLLEATHPTGRYGKPASAQAFQRLALAVLVSASLQVVAPQGASTGATLIAALAMITLSGSAFLTIARPYLSMMAHQPGLTWAALPVDLRMAEDPEVRVPTKTHRKITLRRPVLGNRVLPFPWPTVERWQEALPVYPSDLELSAVEHLQAVELRRLNGPLA